MLAPIPQAAPIFYAAIEAVCLSIDASAFMSHPESETGRASG